MRERGAANGSSLALRRVELICVAAQNEGLCVRGGLVFQAPGTGAVVAGLLPDVR